MPSHFLHPIQKATSPTLFGGKASNLSTLAKFDKKIPYTIVLSREALKSFLSENNFTEIISTYIKEEKISQTRYHEIIETVKSSPIPLTILAEIKETTQNLLQKFPYGLAVRSSAVYEDSANASFAGVFESFLGLVRTEEILEKIVECWCCSWSPKALRYMRRMNIQPEIDAMAVMIQEVIPAISSGVIYTADPLSGNPWRFVINATQGLSEDLMSGSGVGDRYVVDWLNSELVEQELGAQQKELKATKDGVQEIIHGQPSSRPVLSSEEISEIMHTALTLDEPTNTRLDIEWAFTNEGLYILQMRPMTALPDFFPHSLTEEQQKSTWNAALVTLPQRPDQAPHLLTPLYCHYSEAKMWHRYQPKDIILTSLCQKELDVNGYRYWEASHQPNFQEYFEGPGEYEAWLEKNVAYYRKRWDNWRKELEEIEKVTSQSIASTSSASELIPTLFAVTERLWDLNSFGWSGPQALGWMCEGALRHFLESHDIEIELPDLLGGDNQSYTFQSTKGQQEVGRNIDESVVIKAFKELPLSEVVPHLRKKAPDCKFLKQLETYCWKNGKIPPSWLERPRFWSSNEFDPQVISAIKNAWLGKGRDIEELQKASETKRTEIEHNIISTLENKRPQLSKQFKRLLEWTRYWGQALNDRHGLSIGLLQERELTWVIGNRLVNEGIIDRSEDILVFRRKDLEDFSQNSDPKILTKKYSDRLTFFRKNRRLKPLPTLGKKAETSETEPIASNEDFMEEGIFKGQGFGGGTAVGKVKKIIKLNADTLESLHEEDILVLPYELAFHHADWHSLLTVVKAVVSPGRPSHHLAQIARECGVPLVGHISGNLDELQEGMLIQVDGTEGWVKVHASGHG